MHSEAAFKCKVCVEDQLCPKDRESGMESKKKTKQKKRCIYSIQILLESYIYQSYYYLPSQSLDS